MTVCVAIDPSSKRDQVEEASLLTSHPPIPPPDESGQPDDVPEPTDDAEIHLTLDPSTGSVEVRGKQAWRVLLVLIPVVFVGALVAADLPSALIGAAITGVCTAVAYYTKDQK